MLYLNIWLTVKESGDVEAVRSLLAQAARLSRGEPGCERFEVYHSTSDSTKFLIHEQWQSQAALDAHRQAQAYTQIYQPQILPRVNREPHPSTPVQ